MTPNAFDRAPAVPPPPPTSEFTVAWTAYGCFGLGLILGWPALIGLVIAYARRREPGAGFIASHHGWLIRTFWWSLLGYLVAATMIAASAGPVLWEAVRTAIAQRDAADTRTLLELPWRSILTAAAGAALGGLVAFATWCWTAYRVVRGALRLGSGIGAP